MICDGDGLVAPPRGERGLKCIYCRQPSPVWWVAPPRGERGLKSCGLQPHGTKERVAPPRGERGLKYPHPQAGDMRPGRRSPSWGAWIEIVRVACPSFCPPVAPPRGERGLKSKLADIALHIVASLPLVGSVD